jgi:hypothetical protein
MNPLPLFYSSADYYTNHHFVRCMRNWNKYLESDEPNEDILVEWEEVCLKDFRKHAVEWLENNYDDTFWREDLA